MSTQSSGYAPVPFSITTPLRNVRLMEVSDELLEIINDEGAVLKFKSAAGQKDGIVHLCSDKRAWAVRQVSTSNSVYVMQPVSADVDVDMDMDVGVDVGGSVAMTATSQVGSFLELNPVPLDDGRVERELVNLLPVYHVEFDDGQDVELLVRNDGKGSRVWGRVVEDVAAPDAVVDRIGGRLCVFGLGTADGGVRCHVPSTRALLAVWSKVVEGCAIEGVKLDGVVSVVRVVNVLYDEVQSKIAERMFEVGGLLDSLGLFVDDGARRLKPVETSRFVAAILLSSNHRGQDGTRSMGLEDFLAKWTDLVPASYLKHCTVENLTSSSSAVFEAGQSEDGNQLMRWKGSGSTESYVLASALAEALVGGGQAMESETTAKSASTSAAADKKRKWHEKFGAQRNAKR